MMLHPKIFTDIGIQLSGWYDGHVRLVGSCMFFLSFLNFLQEVHIYTKHNSLFRTCFMCCIH